MPIDSSQLASRLNEQIAALYRERDGHVAAISDIDGKIAKALQLLGLDPSEVTPGTGSAMPRLPISEFARSYPLQPDTMGSVMLDILLNADHGYSRPEMRRELEKHPKFAKQIANNINSYYNTVNRYRKTGRVVLINNLLYHPDRAPLPEGETDPTGQHLPSNVSTLFPDRKAGGDE